MDSDITNPLMGQKNFRQESEFQRIQADLTLSYSKTPAGMGSLNL